MKETQANMEESERDTERGNSEQEKNSDHPGQNEDLLPKRGVFFCRMDVVWVWKVWHEPEHSTLQIMPQTGPHNRLKHQEPLLPPTQESRQTVWREK